MKAITIAVLITAGLWTHAGHSDEPTTLADHYGFLGPEVYKLDARISNLIARDIDGDGKLDLAVINNLRNRIDVLAQRDPGAKPAEESTGNVNDIPNDRRMEHRKIQVRRGVMALEIKDVNSDGRADLVYLGDPKGLYIEYQQADGTFGQDRVYENPDAQVSSWCLDVGDLNGDGKNDIAYLGVKYLYLLYQQDDGQLGVPQRFRLGDDQPGLLRIIDLDADGRNDLVYFAQSSELPIRIRYQSADRSFGPERRLRIDPPRGVSFAEVDGQPGQEVLSISSLNDRLMVYRFDRAQPTDDRPTSQVLIFPFDSTGTGKSVDTAVADFDGNGTIDTVVSDADSSQFQFFASTEKMESFPCQLGTESLRAVDVNKDGRSSLISLSSKDGSIAISEFLDGRLTFPNVLSSRETPTVMEVLGTGPDARLIYVAKVAGDKRDQYALFQLKPANGNSDLDWIADDSAGVDGIPVTLPVKPTDLRSADLNGDGISDLLIFFISRPPVILMGQGTGKYQLADDSGKGTLGNLSPADVYVGPVFDQANAFLVTQEGFARQLRLEDGGRWSVVDQFNASAGSAKVRGVVSLDLIGDATPELVMYDRSSQSLVFLRTESGIYRAWQTLKVGNFDVRGMRVADFNADGTKDIMLFDGVKMGVVFTRAEDVVLNVATTYETDNKDATLFDMVPGDLNGDHVLDILLLDPLDHNLEVVTTKPGPSLERALRWQVFEEKTFRRQTSSIEPREAIIADVDADGLDDIALLVHDRLLIYPQDDGREVPAPSEP